MYRSLRLLILLVVAFVERVYPYVSRIVQADVSMEIERNTSFAFTERGTDDVVLVQLFPE